jgi:small-conductance mechanosensitive channel
MSDFTAAKLTEIGHAILQWLLVNVFVLDNAVQLLVVAAAFGAATVLARRLVPLFERLMTYRQVATLVGALLPLVLPLTWLLLQWLAILAAGALRWPHHVLEIAASLLTAWVAIRLVSQLAPNPMWAKVITWTVWSIAALNILNLLEPTIALLDSAAITVGQLRVSLYTVVKSAAVFAVLLSLAIYVTGLIENKIRTSRALSPTVQVLFSKGLKATLIALAVLISVNTIGIDLTGLAVVGGALGLGAGFGFQKVISNMVSGIVLLLDKSIRPGDVIAVSGTYGWVTQLGGRYVSVVTRDGVEHLIPNETLISERVENWTHSNSYTRLKIAVPVHYDTDLHRAIDLCLSAAKETSRVLTEPEPRCLLIAFGDSSLDLELRIWIADAHNGVQNVKSAVLLRIWELFREHGIVVPYQQIDLHLSAAQSVPEVVRRPAASG